VTLCGTGVEVTPREGMTDGARRYETWLNGLTEPEDIERDLFVECPVPHPTFFMRAAAVSRVGGYRLAPRPTPEDYDLLLRMWRDGGRFMKVDAPLLEWRDRPDRLQRTHGDYTHEAFRHCKLDHLEASLLRGRDGVVVCGAGPTGKAFARAAADRGIDVRAFLDLDPRKIGQTVHGAPVRSTEAAGDFPRALIVAAVARSKGRTEVRRMLETLGLREMRDFVAVA
jgi:hypothetical protein